MPVFDVLIDLGGHKIIQVEAPTADAAKTIFEDADGLFKGVTVSVIDVYETSVD